MEYCAAYIKQCASIATGYWAEEGTEDMQQGHHLYEGQAEAKLNGAF